MLRCGDSPGLGGIQRTRLNSRILFLCNGFISPGRVGPVFKHTPKTQKSYTSRIAGRGPGGTFFLVKSASSKPDAIILGDSAGALALDSLRA